MAHFRFYIIYFLWVIQDPVTCASAETQLLGYEETPGLDLHTDDLSTNHTILTDPGWAFPSDGHVVAFNVRVHGNGLGSNFSLQIWRPVSDVPGQYKLVGVSRDTDSSTTGYQRIELNVPQSIQRGDVIGLYSSGQNPVPYHIPKGQSCNETGYLYIEGGVGIGGSDISAGGSDVTKTFTQSGECRWYLMTAEYQLQDVDLPMTILGDDVKSRIEPDATENSVVLPHSDAGFTADGVLYGWKAFLQEPMQQVSFQVWRHIHNNTYRKIHESPPYSQPASGAIHVRLRETERSEVKQGDVIAIGYPKRNPIRYDWSRNCDHPFLMGQPYNSSERIAQEFATPVDDKKPCRRYSFQAEYYYAMPAVPSGDNTTDTENGTTTMLPSVSTSGTLSTTPATSPTTTQPEQALFGWEVSNPSRSDGVHSGTIIPDAGKNFPHDGKVIGWEFTAHTLGYKVGLQVWRPLPKHPDINPHGRDFAFVGSTKPILPWHLGLNRFTFDQVQESPFHVRKGDVLALSLDDPNPIPFSDSNECTGSRYYMQHHADYDPCDQYVFERTVNCRVYPLRAIVIWDTEIGKKANECTGETPSLVPPPPRTHIDGCVLLNIGHADATYLLTNPDYPNITKHRDLCWVIHLDPSQFADRYIQVKINDLDLRVPSKCDSTAPDFLEFRDGERSTSRLARRYCVGWAAGNDVIARTDVITACNYYLYIRLRTSTASYRFKGFKLHYHAIEKSVDGNMCIRNLPIVAPNGEKSRNAAIITVAVIVVVIAVVCLFAYFRKVVPKIPQWLHNRFFRHQPFHNQDHMGAGDSPRHVNSSMVPSDLHASSGLPAPDASSGYVTFVPGGYPTNGEAVLQLGKIATDPNTKPNDSSVMEGITEIPPEHGAYDMQNGWSPQQQNIKTDSHGDQLNGNGTNRPPQNNNLSSTHSDHHHRLNGLDNFDSIT